MQKLTLPKLGQSMEEGTILEWLVDENGSVSKGDPILIFETDKTSSEITAAEDGKLLSKKISEGETVSVGTVLGFVGQEGETLPDQTDPTLDKESEIEQTEQKEASANESGSSDPKNINTGSKNSQTHETGGTNETGFYRATPSARRAARGHGVDIDLVGQELEIEQITTDHVREYINSFTPENETLGSPYARKIASENNVDITEVGQKFDTERVRANHVKRFIEEIKEDSSVQEDDREDLQTRDQSTLTVREDRSIEGAQKVMFDRMSQVASDYCSTTTVAKVDITDLLALQERLAEAWGRKHDVEPSLTAFVTKAVAEQLSSYPELNAELVNDETFRLFEDINIGLAVDTDHGLLVPTIYDTPSLSVRELSTEINDLASRARDGDLSYDEMQNGTFTISNAGSLGTYMNTPKIFPPQTAILGLCAVFEELELIDGDVVPRKKVHLCLTYDHRVVEGASAVGFVQSVGSLLENAEALLS
jgi:pyruvate/2-oxoglutarate dehydrogenase complex dihydrolipoamide acyltransferase (E2) component